MADDALIVAEGLTKQFGAAPSPAIDRLTARIEAGRVTGLVGPDAAGKTTLLRLFAGLLLPSAGKLTVCGAATDVGLPAIRQQVSYMPQQFGLYEDLSVRQNLNLYADLWNVVGDERNDTFERLYAFTDLKPFTDRLAGRLSGGMKQKLGLACALIRKPRLLLLDEPSVGVDPISRRELWKMVYELVDQGIGVVWSTSYLDEAERCAEVLLLNSGQVLYVGPPKELTSRVEGRTYVASGGNRVSRKLLADALRLPDVIDGVIQGRNVRLVMKEGSQAPRRGDLGNDVEVNPTPPRFEDAFVDLLGGGPKTESPLKAQAHKDRDEGAVVVEAAGLTKKFGDFTAADQITFRIGRGESFPDYWVQTGAGKSTTFKMMCGLLRPTAGTARVSRAWISTKRRGRRASGWDTWHKSFRSTAT